MSVTPLRLRLVLAFVLWVIAGKITTTGLENLEAVKRHVAAQTAFGRPFRLIIASGHISNLDMLAAISVFAKTFKLKIINKSLQYSFIHRPVEWIAMHAAGARNFLPISYHIEDVTLGNGWTAAREVPRFIPKDFIRMKQALEAGEVVLIAAHNPSVDWTLPATSGYGAVYLAELAQPCFIMPLTIDVQSKHPTGVIDILPSGTFRQKLNAFFRRPPVHIHIHPVKELQSLIGLQRFTELADRQGRLSASEKNEFAALRELRLAEGKKIMADIASALPPGKRGSRVL